mmetsp:Transcript_12421/g.26827  ORF Transcript_12421/g.26827 Transcript_12421/m.26827 type:complete len:254 (-) Transcript_12421:63-824(-)
MTLTVAPGQGVGFTHTVLVTLPRLTIQPEGSPPCKCASSLLASQTKELSGWPSIMSAPLPSPTHSAFSPAASANQMAPCTLSRERGSRCMGALSTNPQWKKSSATQASIGGSCAPKSSYRSSTSSTAACTELIAIAALCSVQPPAGSASPSTTASSHSTPSLIKRCTGTSSTAPADAYHTPFERIPPAHGWGTPRYCCMTGVVQPTLWPTRALPLISESFSCTNRCASYASVKVVGHVAPALRTVNWRAPLRQ